MSEPVDLLTWLREQCAEYQFDVGGAFRRESSESRWPLVAEGPDQLEALLQTGGHLLPLPTEPAALANVLEVSIVEFIMDRLGAHDGAGGVEGNERSYPDLEICGEMFGGGVHAVDVKVAKRAKTKRRPPGRTQSRITLYTGNTYFKWPELHWPGTFRPFNEYASHLDLLAVYTLDPNAYERVRDLELYVHEAWRVASTKRSSTTREYIGAVNKLDDLRDGNGEFVSAEEFYKFWRGYHFKISEQVQKQLQQLLASQKAEIARLRSQK